MSSDPAESLTPALPGYAHTPISAPHQPETTWPPSMAEGMLDVLPDHIALLDASGTIVAVNAAWERFARENGGLARTTGAGTNYLSVCRAAAKDAHDQTAQRVLEGLQALLAGTERGFTLEYPCHSPTERRWFLMRALPAPASRPGAMVVHTDITARKLAEEEQARLSEVAQAAARQAAQQAQELEAVFTALPDGVVVFDQHGRAVRASALDQALTGPTADEPLEARARRLGLHAGDGVPLPQERIPGFRVLHGEALTAEHPADVYLPTPDGRQLELSVTGSPIRSPEGGIAGAVLVYRDVTRERQAARRYRALLEMAPDATLVTDRDGRIQLVNRQAEVLFGYAREEVVGQPVELLIPGRFHAIHRQHRADYVAAPSTRPMGANLSLFGRRQDGSEFPVEVSLGPLQDGSEGQIIVSIRDMSEVQRVQAANQELRRLLLLTDTALAHLSLDDLLPQLLDRVQEVMAVDNVVILSLDEEGQQLRVRASKGLEDAVAAGVHVPVGQGFAGRIAASRAPLIVDDLSTFPVVNPFLSEKLRSVAGVPLLLRDRVVGVLHVGTTAPHHFTEQDMRLLERVAERVAVAVERAQLFKAEQHARQEAQTALERALASESRFHRLVDSGIIGIMIGDGIRVLDANDAYLHLLGYTQADLQAGRLTRQLLVPPDPEMLAATERAISETLATGACRPFEREYLRSDGSRVPILLGMALLQRDPPRFVTFVVDLSERKRLELEAEARARQLEATIEAMPDAVLLTDAQARIVRGNAAYHALYGTAEHPEYLTLPVEERARLQHVRDLAGHPLPTDATPARRILREGTIPSDAPLELRIRTLDERELVLSVTGGPVHGPEGQVAGTVLVLRDVTARRRLEQQQRFQASMLERAHDAIFLWELGGPIVYWNQGAELLYGYPAEEALGRGCHELLHTRLPEPAADFEARLARVGEWTGELTHTTHDGREVEVLVRLQVLTEEDEAGGERLYVVETTRDITERKQLEREREAALRQSEAWFRTMANTAPVLLWVAGTDGLVTFLNDPWLHFTGRQLEQEVGNGWAEGVHPDDYQHCMETYLTAFHARQSFTMEYRLRRHDGEYRWMLDTGVPRFAPDGTFAGYIGSAIDVTEREQLKHDREEARASALAAREVAQQLDQFFAMASHDIRTPVTALSGNVDIARLRVQRLAAALRARGGEDVALVAPVVAALDRADVSKERLLRLVKLLFDVASARAGTLKLNLAPCDLVAFVREQVATQQATIRTRAIQLDLPDQPVPVLADADRLAQVLMNYLSNALKYSPDDQPIVVRLEVTLGLAVVSVQDHGPGLPLEEQSRVWELYHRAPGVEVQSTSSATSGSLGLGLYTCQRLIQLHPGGQVGVESVVGEGSTFWFRLPVASDHPIEQP